MSTDFTGNTGPFPISPYAQQVVVGNKYMNLTASAQIKSSEGWLAGIFVNSSTSGTLKLYDNAAATGTVICNTFTPSLGWNPCPMHFMSALYATVAGTLDCTFVYS